jgi:hypothetical protein
LQGFQFEDSGDGPDRRLIDVVLQFPDAFSDGSPGHVTGMQFALDTDDSKLRPLPLRPLGPAKRAEEARQIAQLLKWDVIEPSTSRLSYPAVIVRQGQKMRYCIDYRNLNEATVPDSYPMQCTDAVFDSLGGHTIFSSLDAARGYHQFDVREEDRWKTTFITHQGLFQYKRMPFGLRNAPAFFQRFMDQLLGNLRWSSALVYIDDVIVFSKSVAEHCLALKTILSDATRLGLRFAKQKCFFGFSSLQLLGRQISSDGLGVLADRTRAIADMPAPTSLGELYTLLGMFGYYRQFIPDYAAKTKPLFDLTKGYRWTKSPDSKSWTMVNKTGNIVRDKSKATISLSDEQRDALNTLKRDLIAAPTLAYADYSKPFILYVDASHKGIGVVLSQIQKKPKGCGVPATFWTTSPESTPMLRAAQKRDPMWTSIIGKLEAETPQAGYTLTDGVLSRVSADGNLICLPEAWIKDMIHDHHDRLGHPGFRRTAHLLLTSFWRPNLASTIKRYVDACSDCARAKRSHNKREGALAGKQHEPIAFNTISLDPILGLPPSGRRKFDAILTIVCLFTKYVILIPCHATMTATDAARLFFEHVTRRGFHPARIISDRSTVWMGEFWSTLHTALGTKLSFSAAYHQQADPVERHNQTVETALRCLCQDNPKDWSNHVAAVELGLNSVPVAATGFSPTKLLYTDHSDILPRLADSPIRTDVDAVDDMLAGAKLRVREAAENMRFAQASRERSYGASHRPPDAWTTSDWAYIDLSRRPIKSLPQNKLAPVFIGPFQVKEVVSPVCVRLALPDTMRISDTFVTAQLKRVRGPPTRPPPPVRAAESAERHIQEILRDDVRDGVRKLLVRFEGDRPGDATWIPADQLGAEEPAAPDVPQPVDDPVPDVPQPVDDPGRPVLHHAPDTPRRASGRLAGKDRVRWDPRVHVAQDHAFTTDDSLPIPGPDEIERVILYHSRQTKPEETRYSISELELAGLTHAVLKCQAYIDGALTYVVTDHAPLRSIVRSDTIQLNERINKCRLLLQPFLPNLRIVYRCHKHQFVRFN